MGVPIPCGFRRSLDPLRESAEEWIIYGFDHDSRAKLILCHLPQTHVALCPANDACPRHQEKAQYRHHYLNNSTTEFVDILSTMWPLKYSRQVDIDRNEDSVLKMWIEEA
jgi:hypothetical protein